jgi:hypothetical protein
MTSQHCTVPFVQVLNRELFSAIPPVPLVSFIILTLPCVTTELYHTARLLAPEYLSAKATLSTLSPAPLFPRVVQVFSVNILVLVATQLQAITFTMFSHNISTTYPSFSRSPPLPPPSAISIIDLG